MPKRSAVRSNPLARDGGEAGAPPPATGGHPPTNQEARRVQYLVIEHFRNRDPVPIYRRLRERGRLMPEGLSYVASWILDDLSRCYQIMETTNRALLEEWMAGWADLIDRKSTRLN